MGVYVSLMIIKRASKDLDTGREEYKYFNGNSWGQF